MSAILDLAESISVDAAPNIRRSTSLNGFVRTEIAGPTFYTITASLPYMRRAQYVEVQEEIINLNYGVNILTTTIPFGITYFEGDWSGTAALTSVSGNDINFSGFNPNQVSTIEVTDYIQFAGDTKVYQASNSPIANPSGNIVLNINTPLIVTPSAGVAITRGSNVEFKLLLASIPPVATITIANGEILYKFAGTFDFVEVL